MKKIKIIQLITGLNTGGAEMVVKDLALNIDKEKFEVVVISILPIGKIGEEIKKSGVKVLSLNAKFKYNPIITWKLFKILKKEKPDILNTHLFHADLMGRIIGRLSKIPKIISTFHSIDIGSKKRELIISFIKDKSDMNIAVSKIVASEMNKRKLSKSGNIKVIYNGVNLEKFPFKNKRESRKKLNIDQNVNLFVSTGRLTKAKGYNYLIKAVKEIKDNSLFIILGEGIEREILEKEVKNEGLENKIILKGNVTNVNDYLQAADFFIMPSLWEGFCIALIEAAVTKKTIITTKVGIVPEIIEKNKNGFLVEPANTEQLVEKINYVLSLSKKEKEKIGDLARKTVKERFSLDKMIKKYEDLYFKLLG
ncbi:MAG TPA: glycosyltransferase [Patescibacteria group bacterium]|nr:glycosyltransferase [Patescibacteria group bacterium]